MDPLKLNNVKLTNLKGFRDIEVPITGPSILLSGDNGNGKSTLLRAIALGLGDKMGAYGLMSELTGSFINYAAEEAIIEIFLSSKMGKEYKFVTTIKKVDKFGTENVDQSHFVKNDNNRWTVLKEDEVPVYDLFCTAYGTGCRTLGKERYHQYYHTDSVYQLFKNDATLSEQELSLRRLLNYRFEKMSPRIDKREMREKREKEIFDTILGVLNLPPHIKINLTDSGIYFENSENKVSEEEYEKTELSAMGDGVRATTTLILDLMSWWYLYLEQIPDSEYKERVQKYNKITASDQYHGIVIIDEIELHLHPSWQMLIIENLVKTFPNVQFIFTTHSAICVAGASELSANSKLRLFRVNPETAIELPLNRGTTVNEVLETQAFGLESSASPKFSPELEKKMDAAKVVYAEPINEGQTLGTLVKIGKAFDNKSEFGNLLDEGASLIKKLEERAGD